jgi:hypothetical protein
MGASGHHLKNQTHATAFILSAGFIGLFFGLYLFNRVRQVKCVRRFRAGLLVPLFHS